MEIISTYFGNEISVMILGSKRGRNVGPRPHRPLLPQRLDKAPGKDIIPSVLCRFDNRLYFQMTGELSRVPLLQPLPTAISRSRPPCSGPEIPWLCSWLEW